MGGVHWEYLHKCESHVSNYGKKGLGESPRYSVLPERASCKDGCATDRCVMGETSGEKKWKLTWTERVRD